MNRRFTSTAIVGLSLIVAHLLVSIIHGSAHQAARVNLDTFGNVYVVIVITLAPLGAGVLLLTRMRRHGALLLVGSMFGSFVFGFWYHFLSATRDHVSQVQGEWHATFLWTAVALSVIELAGTVAGSLIYKQLAGEPVSP